VECWLITGKKRRRKRNLGKRLQKDSGCYFRWDWLEDFFERVKTEQKSELYKGPSHISIWENEFSAEGTESEMP